MPHIVIRADASAQIGSGHIMRCLALANALTRQHATTVLFVVRHLPPALADLLQQQGHQIAYLMAAQPAGDELSHSVWLGVSQQDDGIATAAILQQFEQPVDWLIMDHYALDQRWQQQVRPYVKQLMVIDDLADRVHDCDVLLDQNQYVGLSQRYQAKVPATAQLLLGARYALLRDEFAVQHAHVQVRTGTVKRLLVFFGGMDAHNYTDRLLSVLPDVLPATVVVDVVIGAQHPELDAIVQRCAVLGYQCHVQTQQMAQLMAHADLAIGAGGSASWERCCLGLPSMAFAIADNQIQLTRDAALLGLVESPQVDWQHPATVANALKALIDNPLARQRMSAAGLQLVDGRGLSRILRALGYGLVTVRPATEADSHALWQWRNHEGIRRVSRDTAEIAWENHQRWFAASLNNPQRLLLVAEKQGQPCGVVRFDLSAGAGAGDSAEVSIYRVPDFNEQGIAVDLLQAAERYAAQHFPQLNIIHAVVLADNHASHHLFSQAGYQRDSTTYLKLIVRV